MMVTRLTIVEFCRWVAGGGSLAFLRHHFFSSSKSRLTVLSAFLLFLLVVAASLFAISHLLPLSSSSTVSPSSTNLLSWFYFSPSSSNNSSNSTPPPPPREKEKKQDDVVVDPLLVNRSGAVSESTYGGNGDGGADSSSMQGPLSGKESDQRGWKSAFPAHAENFTKNNTLASATDRSTGGEASGEVTGKSFASESKPPNGTSIVAPKSSDKEISGEVVIGKSFASESKTPDMTSSTATKSSGNETSGEAVIAKSFASESQHPDMTSSCVGAEKQILVRNSTIKDVCFKGQISEKKSGAMGEDHQMKQQHGEMNQGGVAVGGGKLIDPVEEAAPAAAAGKRNDSRPTVAVKATGGSSEQCDIFHGRWVRAEKNQPYYPAGSCPYLDDDFNCHKNGRPDSDFLKWRWQPYDCDIPRLNASDFLGRLRGKRLVFVGDSLNRNMWESLVCILRHSISNKKRVYEVSGRSQFKVKGRRNHFKYKGYYSFRFEDYQCSVDFVRSPFLVREMQYKNVHGSEDERLRLDILDETTLAYREADVIVFNTGHWWTHEQTSRGRNYYQEGNHVYPVLKVMEAYKKALTTWSRWIDMNIDSSKTQVVFRGYSLTHFRGGQWNSGGQCHKETEPIFNQSYLSKYPSKMRVVEQILKQTRTPVIYLNISRLTDYRKDGHPSIYRKKYMSVEEQIAAEKSQDCSHWCLPGIPDSWNELLYASLLIVGKGSWRR
ncbi:protein trichome birefringence-like 2 [Musa acuminata AAA Group]|uniref:protein trichome birefringence-like 2 n=1 Tax=Musa acuminata AAA Group TaxID=214697 RepID=UPI0031D8630D